MTYVAFPAEQPDLFGPLQGGREVRQAVLATIQAWSPTYIPVMAERTGLTLLPFGTWEAVYDERTMPSSKAPACWVTTPGTDPRRLPVREGTGMVRTPYLVDVNVAARAGSWDETGDLLSTYAVAVRALLVQHGSLGGLAVGTAWLGEAYREMQHTPTRSVGLVIVRFSVVVPNLVDTSAGPKTLPTGGNPPVPPGTQGPGDVLAVNVTIQKEGLD